jgi:hypothetical protein
VKRLFSCLLRVVFAPMKDGIPPLMLFKSTQTSSVVAERDHVSVRTVSRQAIKNERLLTYHRHRRHEGEISCESSVHSVEILQTGQLANLKRNGATIVVLRQVKVY